VEGLPRHGVARLHVLRAQPKAGLGSRCVGVTNPYVQRNYFSHAENPLVASPRISSRILAIPNRPRLCTTRDQRRAHEGRESRGTAFGKPGEEGARRWPRGSWLSWARLSRVRSREQKDPARRTLQPRRLTRELVSQPVNGVNVLRPPRVGFELLAQPGDVDVDGAG
jgi:hypothetical protein